MAGKLSFPDKLPEHMDFGLYPLVLILPTAEEVSFFPSGHTGWQMGN